MTQIDDALSKLRAGALADALESHRLEFKQEDPNLKRNGLRLDARPIGRGI